MTKNSFTDHLATWDLMLAGLNAHQGDLTYLEANRAALESVVASLRALQSKREALMAEAQQGTHDLKAFLEQAEDLASRLRNGIRAYYGRYSDTLSEFGLKPAAKHRKPSGVNRNPTAP